MSSAARARLVAMRGAPAPKSRAVAAAAARLTSAIRRQNVMAGTRRATGRLRRRNQMTAGFLGVELKYQDMWYPYTTVVSATTPDNTCRINPTTNQGTPAAPVNVAIGALNAVCQGDGPWNRDGKKIRLRSLYIKGSIFRPCTAAGTLPEPLTAYVACVLDKQPNAAELAPGQVFVNPNAVIVGAGSWLRHLEYSDRYRILRDQVFTFPANVVPNGANYTAGGVVRHFEWFIPLNIDTLFNTTTPTSATVASIVTNAIGMVANASTSAAGLACAITYNARLRFVG